MLAACVAFREVEPRAIVKDIAVLQNLDERRAFMRGGVFQGLFQVLLEDVDGASDESRLRANRERNRIEGAVERAEGSRLGFLIELRCRRILALGQPVDAVIEEQNLEADISAEHVSRVISADGEGIAIARRDPYFEVG